MKVLFLCRISGISGAENYILEALPALNQSGLQANMACVYEPANLERVTPFIERLKSDGVDVIPIPESRAFSLPLLLKLRKMVREYDILHTHLIHADVWGAMIRVTTSGIRVVSTKHGYQDAYGEDYLRPEQVIRNSHYKAARWAEGRMHGSLAISNGLRDFYVNTGISRKMDVVHYGFDFKESDLSESGDLRSSPHQLIIVGRLIKLKGHAYVIRVLPELLKEFPDIQLNILGNGDYRETLEQLVDTLHLRDHVHFLGFQRNVSAHMAASDVVLVPSTAEGFGLVVLEGFHVGKPVIGFDVYGVNEIIDDGVDGFLVPPFEEEILRDRIAALLREPEKAHHMGQKGKQKLASYFNLDRMTRETIAFYERIFNRH